MKGCSRGVCKGVGFVCKGAVERCLQVQLDGLCKGV